MMGFEQYDFFSTKEFETIWTNTRIVVSALFAMIGGLDFLLLLHLSNHYGIVIAVIGLFSCVFSYLLWSRSAVRQLVKRDFVVVVEWVVSFVLLVIGLCPILLHVFLGMDWTMLEKYGWKILDLYCQFEYFMLPVSIMGMVSLFYWISTVQVYKKGYLAHLSFIKKKEIYGE